MQSLAGRKVLVAFVALQFLFTPSFSHAATKSITGTLCKVSGTAKTVSGKKYICTSVNKKLVWKLRSASVPTPTAIDGPSWAEIEADKAAFVGPTWIQIDAEKTAAELKVKLEAEAVKAAAELKIKLEAEAKAAAELKAKLEAEAAKAAKAEAEKPKIQGLTIGNLLWADDFRGAKDSAIDSKKWSARN